MLTLVMQKLLAMTANNAMPLRLFVRMDRTES